MYRQTFVVEYESETHVPSVNCKTEVLGGRLVSVQFSDALLELEILHELCDQDILDEAAAKFAAIS